MIVFHHPDCLLHDPPYEILSGKLVRYYESPSRIESIKKVLLEDPRFILIDELNTNINLEERILKVHDADYLDYLKTSYRQWVEEGGDHTAVFPDTVAHIALISGKPKDLVSLPSNAKAGLYCFDMSCPITKDTYKATLASALVALTAAGKVLALNTGERGVFALCRPPGHHSAASVCGGYCFLNNAAIATKYIQDRITSRGQVKPSVAILDIDYHHGNGTQDIFYDDPSVLYVSLHAENDYPYFTGKSSETGVGVGQGFSANYPLSKSSTDDNKYCDTLIDAVQRIRQFGPAFLIVSLGVDTHINDPICDFKITTDCYKQIGSIIATVKTPTLFVMEGGYHIPSIGANVRNVLVGFEESVFRFERNRSNDESESELNEGRLREYVT